MVCFDSSEFLRRCLDKSGLQTTTLFASSTVFYSWYCKKNNTDSCWNRFRWFLLWQRKTHSWYGPCFILMVCFFLLSFKNQQNAFVMFCVGILTIADVDKKTQQLHGFISQCERLLRLLQSFFKRWMQIICIVNVVNRRLSLLIGIFSFMLIFFHLQIEIIELTNWNIYLVFLSSLLAASATPKVPIFDFFFFCRE